MIRQPDETTETMMNKKASQSTGNTTMTQADASRIQSAEAKRSGGGVARDSFAARAQSTAARNLAKTTTTKK